MDVRRTSEGDSAELRKRDKVSIAGAIHRLEVLDDPFGVLFAEGCLAAKGVGDGLAGGLVRDVSIANEYSGDEKRGVMHLRSPARIRVGDDLHVD